MPPLGRPCVSQRAIVQHMPTHDISCCAVVHCDVIPVGIYQSPHAPEGGAHACPDPATVALVFLHPFSRFSRTHTQARWSACQHEPRPGSMPDGGFLAPFPVHVRGQPNLPPYPPVRLCRYFSIHPLCGLEGMLTIISSSSRIWQEVCWPKEAILALLAKNGKGAGKQV